MKRLTVKTARLYTPEEVAKFRKYGDVTPNGVAFDWWLVSAEGAGFCLMREPHHSDVDIEKAARHLYGDRDVLGTVQTAEVA